MFLIISWVMTFWLSNALLSDLSWVGVLGGEGDGSKHVHDQVNPEKLNHIEGRVAKKKILV